MLYQLKIKLRTPILAVQTCEKTGHKVFPLTTDKTKVILNEGRWRWAISESINALRLPIHPETIIMGEYFDKPAFQILNKKTRMGSNKVVKQPFEIIQKDTTLSLKVLTTVEEDPDARKYPGVELRPTTKRDLLEVFPFIGEYLGVSYFGSNQRYGRFNVVELEEFIKEESSGSDSEEDESTETEDVIDDLCLQGEKLDKDLNDNV